jgi:hypothetical protein
LLTADTARWSWYVTPKVGGTHTLTLKVRPIVKEQREDRTTPASVSAENSNVQEYETSVDVKVPLTERPQETMSRLAATFKVAEGLVTALTALVAAEATNSHSDHFVRNLTAPRAEERLGLGVFRPASLVQVTGLS